MHWAAFYVSIHQISNFTCFISFFRRCDCGWVARRFIILKHGWWKLWGYIRSVTSFLPIKCDFWCSSPAILLQYWYVGIWLIWYNILFLSVWEILYILGKAFPALGHGLTRSAPACISIKTRQRPWKFYGRPSIEGRKCSKTIDLANRGVTRLRSVLPPQQLGKRAATDNNVAVRSLESHQHVGDENSRIGDV